jgi:hypothetical protein
MLVVTFSPSPRLDAGATYWVVLEAVDPSSQISWWSGLDSTPPNPLLAEQDSNAYDGYWFGAGEPSPGHAFRVTIRRG